MKWYKYDIRELSDKEYCKWYSLMSDEKQRRVDRFRFGDDKKRTVAGEMLARKAISDWCSVNAEDIIFDYKEYGKPYAIDLDVEFNISHSCDLVVCAIDNSPVGIDVEKIRPIDLNVAKRFCNKEELFYLFGHELAEEDFIYTSETDILSRFFEIWTKKEAYGKFIGFGLLPEDPNHKTSECDISVIIENSYMITICKKEKSK